MDREFFLRIVFATHRVADTLPEEEEIRYHIKNSATRIVADLFLFLDEVVSIEHKKIIISRTLVDIQILQDNFTQVRRRNWVNPANFLILEKEYDGIREFLRESGFVAEVQVTESVRGMGVSRQQTYRSRTQVRRESSQSLSERQKKILEILEHQQKAQVWEIQKVLPEVTKRTLRRDLDDLLHQNLVERQGEWNEVSYRLKSPGANA